MPVDFGNLKPTAGSLPGAKPIHSLPHWLGDLPEAHGSIKDADPPKKVEGVNKPRNPDVLRKHRELNRRLTANIAKRATALGLVLPS